jgi:tripeptide aminopeptidase
MKHDIVEYFFQMVKIDSESGNEKEFLTFLSHLFEKELNASSKFDNHGNLIIKIDAKNSNKKKPVLFCCHGDTVNPGQGIVPVLKDGIITSQSDTILGADDKAGIAEILVALKNAPKYPPVEIVITRQEEIGLAGSLYLDRDLIEAEEGYVLDSEELDEIIIGGPSHAEIIIKIRGKAAHAVEPENGISAIEVAAHGISLLQTGWIDPVTTVNVGLIEGGQVLNAVPENTTIQIECRSQKHKKCVSQSKKIVDTFKTVAKARGAKVDVKTSIDLKASKIPENADIVKVAKKAIQSTGLKPKAKIICGGTDASNLNQKGLKTAVLGTGCRLPHSKDEHIAVKDMEKAVEIYTAILKEYA